MKHRRRQIVRRNRRLEIARVIRVKERPEGTHKTMPSNYRSPLLQQGQEPEILDEVAVVNTNVYRSGLEVNKLTSIHISLPSRGFVFDDEIATVQPREPKHKRNK